MPQKLAENVVSVALMLLVSIVATAEEKRVLADRHQTRGLVCANCHRSGSKKTVSMKRCLACHESYAKVAERTKSLVPNPHDSHLTDLECSKCHLGHSSQENYCLTCHEEMEFKKS